MAEVVNRRVDIYIGHQAAEAALGQLEKKQAQFNKRIDECRTKQADLQVRIAKAAAAGESIHGLQKQYDKVSESIKATTAQLDKNATAQQKLKDQIASGLNSTFAQQQALVLKLRNELKHLSDNAPGYAEKLKAYEGAVATFDQLKSKIDGVGESMDSLKKLSISSIVSTAIGTAAGNAITGVVEKIKELAGNIVEDTAKISDELSDIQKTTGLTSEQVNKVNRELDKMDTRTSSEKLRQLAAEAGKLGNSSVEDVKKFVEQANIIDVALGEDLGEDAIIQISKMSKIFDTEMINIASSINSIGAASEASESFQVDFLSRVAGVANTAALGAPDLLAYAAALEINGQTAEVSGTAMTKFFLDFVGDTKKFAAAAGFAAGELEGIMSEKGTNSAFLAFLERLRVVAPTSEQMIQKLKPLGIEGGGAANVFLTLANNLELVRKQQEVANESFKAGTSVIQEYNVKNNNAAGELAKLKKAFSGLFTGETIRDAVTSGIRVLTGLFNLLRSLPEIVMENKVAILTLVAGLILMNGQLIAASVATLRARTAQIAYNTGFAIGNTLLSASISLQAAYITVTNLLTGRITAAAAAQRLWNIAISSNALGVLLVVVGAAIALFSSLTRSTERLTAAARVHKEVNNQVADATAEQSSKIQYLTNIINDNTLSQETRKKALEELIAINPTYLNGLTLENAATAEGKKLIDDYITSIRAKAKEEAAAAIRSQKLQEDMRLALLEGSVEGKKANNKSALSDLSDDEREFLGNNWFSRNSGAIMNVITWSNSADRALDGIRGARQKLKQEMDALDTILKKEFTASAPSQAPPPKSPAEQTVADKKAALEFELASLKEAYSKIAAEDKKAQAANMARQKQIQKELKGLSGSKDISAEHAEKLSDELKAIARDLAFFNATQYEKDVKDIYNKYEKLEARAKGNAKAMAMIEELKSQEMRQLNQRYYEDANKQLQRAAYDQRQSYKKEQQELREQLLLNATVAAKALTARTEAAISLINRDQVAKRELAVRKAGFFEQLKAQKEFLAEQKRQELNNINLTKEERILIVQKYHEEELKTELEFAQKILSAVTTWAEALLSVYDAMSASRKQQQDNEIARDRTANDKQKQAFQRQLDAKVITRAQYDIRVSKLDKQLEEKEKKARLDQFEREKTASIVRANIQIAQAVLQALSSAPPPYNFILAGLVAAAGGIQLLNIKNQEPPEFGDGGFLKDGPKHNSRHRGLPVVNPYTGRPSAYLEQGEAIVNARTMSDGRRYTVSGTPSEITSTLNGLGGGVRWDAAAEIKPFWQTQARPINLARVRRSMDKAKMMELGGLFNSDRRPTTTSANSPAESNNEALMIMIERNTQAINDLNNRLARGIMAKTFLTEQEAQQARLDDIRSEATFKQ
jgi:TP901 family phage tail tape measure protein